MKRQQHRRAALQAGLASLVARALGALRSTTSPRALKTLAALKAMRAPAGASAVVATRTTQATPATSGTGPPSPGDTAGTGGAAVSSRPAPTPDPAPLPGHPRRDWYLEARRMRELAESWGDQSYGAVVVAGGRVIGHGPSRVVKDSDPEAHAERVALREALAAQGGARLTGAVLYSTSRPCAACERAAARAGVLRMFHGEGLHDAGAPQAR